MPYRTLSVFASLFIAGMCQGQSPTKVDPLAVDFFERRVRPVLAENCFKCHGAEKQRAGVRVDSRMALIKGNEAGPLLVPGDPAKSPMLKAIRHEGEFKMPPDKKLSVEIVRDIETWIKAGAPWPETAVAKTDDADAWRSHWAFKPVVKPVAPKIADAAWAKNPIDAFVFSKMTEKGLAPNPLADRPTLLKRIKMTLLGLPATIKEIAEFQADSDPEATAKWIDRYLASPHYGERWARHWMDISRFADTKGYVFQEERKYPFAYTYRDYLIRSINEDVPYDRFIIEQIAGDRLVASKQADPKVQAGMGFLTLGRRFLNNIHDIIDDRLDVVGRGLMGVSIGCARCHDHKYDPISMKEYYGLYGVFASSEEPKDGPLLGAPTNSPEKQAFEKKLAELQKAADDYREKYKKELAEKNRKNRNEERALQKKVDAFKANSPAAPPRAMALVDLPTPREPVVFLRGNPNNRGPAAKRQFLTLATVGEPKPFSQGSGRLELAKAIASKDNPLTARVFANRVWAWHFGAGLVASPSDFGVRSDPPSHPELLDYLAWQFMHEGWSMKKLHRMILTSRAFQQASSDNLKAREVDPENRLLAKANRRRLDFEAMRDRLLAVSGKLDDSLFGPSVDILAKPYAGRRSVYAFIERQNLPGLFRTFDFASPDTTSPKRFETVVPQQALFLLNHEFVREQVHALLGQAEIRETTEPTEKIRKIYRQVLAREPMQAELEPAREFIARNGAESASSGFDRWHQFVQVLLVSNEFMFID